MNSYELSRNFWDYTFENPEKIKPIHPSIYFFAIEHCNRLGWKKKFGLPSQMVMEAIGVKNWKTYSKGLNDLIDWGFIELIEKSVNQYSSNIIAMVNFTKANDKALDKALSNHSQKHSPKQSQITVSVDKQLNNKTNKQEKPPTPKGELPFKYDVYLEEINKMFGRNHKVVSDKLKRSIQARLREGYKNINFHNAMVNVKNSDFHKETNYIHVDPYFFTQESKLSKYGDKIRNENKPNKIGATTEYYQHD